MAFSWREIWAFRKIIVFIAVPVLLLPLPMIEQSKESRCAYIILLMGAFWITEVVPINVTGLIPVLLLPTLGIISVSKTANYYIQDATVLITAVLMLASAAQRWNLPKRSALRFLMLVGSEPRWLLFGVMVPTWFASLWIGNAAATIMMMPIVDVILEQIKNRQTEKESLSVQHGNDPQGDDKVKDADVVLKEEIQDLTSHDTENNVPISEVKQTKSKYTLVELDMTKYHRLSKALCLSVCYAANIGGIGTVVGTASNVILFGQTNQLYENRELESPLTYGSWMAFAIPTSILCLLVAWCYLQIIFFRCSGILSTEHRVAMKKGIQTEYNKLGRMSFAEYAVLSLGIVLVLLWFFRHPWFMPGWDKYFKAGTITDSVPAIFICVLLFVIPAKKPNVFCWRNNDDSSAPQLVTLLDWETVHRNVPWMIIWLLGGSYAMIEGAKVSGLSELVSLRLSSLDSMSLWLLVLIITFVAVSISEIISGPACVTILLSILPQMAIRLNVSPLLLTLPATIATSFAFMLPVATASNTMVFSRGKLSVVDMIMSGAILNVVCLLILALATNTWGQALFNFNELPDIMRSVANDLNNNTNSSIIRPTLTSLSI